MFECRYFEYVISAGLQTVPCFCCTDVGFWAERVSYTMSQQRLVAGRCSSSSTTSSSAVPCIHRPFEDPPSHQSSSTRRMGGPGPHSAFPDSTAGPGVLLQQRGKTLSSRDRVLDGGLRRMTSNSLQVRVINVIINVFLRFCIRATLFTFLRLLKRSLKFLSITFKSTFETTETKNGGSLQRSLISRAVKALIFL